MSLKSTNFLVSIVDTNFSMFKQNDEQAQFIEKIAEHIKRLEEISDGHHFYIDDVAFEALGQMGFPLRFTRVFTKHIDIIKRSNDYRVHDINELAAIINTKEKFMPNTQVFFIGSSDFLLKCAKYSKKLLLTVVNRQFDESIVIDKFPLAEMKEIFHKRESIQPELLEQIKLYKKMKQKRTSNQKDVTIADNGLKIIQDVKVEHMDAADDIMNTPDYMFYEFRK